MDEIKQENLKKLANEILSGGKQAVEGFNYAEYTEEELKFLMQEMNKRNTRDLDEFMQKLDACK
jgi:hypothetical protein